MVNDAQFMLHDEAAFRLATIPAEQNGSTPDFVAALIERAEGEPSNGATYLIQFRERSRLLRVARTANQISNIVHFVVVERTVATGRVISVQPIVAWAQPQGAIETRPVVIEGIRPTIQSIRTELSAKGSQVLAEGF